MPLLFLRKAYLLIYLLCFSTHRFYKKEVLGCEGDSVLSAPGVMMQTYHLCERTFGTMEIWIGMRIYFVFPQISLLVLV